MARAYRNVPYVRFEETWYPMLLGFKSFSEEEIQRRFAVSVANTVNLVVLEGERKSYKMVSKGSYGLSFTDFPSEELSAVASNIVGDVRELAFQGVFAALLLVKSNYKAGSGFITDPFIKDELVAQAFAASFNKYVRNNKACVVVGSDQNTIPAKEIAKPVSPIKVEEKAVSRNENHFYVEPEANKSLTLAHLLAQKTGFANVLLTGPSGFGKTTLAYLFAAKTKREFVKVDMSLVTEASEILGSLALVDGTTQFNETPFTQAIKKGNCVILLDEINRAYPNVTNPLLGLLDDTHSVTYAGTTYNVAPNTVFVVTANIGSQYTGTFKSDAALLNRMNFTCTVGDLPPEEEAKIYVNKTGVDRAQAVAIVKALIDCRSTFVGSPIDFSPRTGISIARIIEFGGSLRFAFISAIGVIEPEEKKSVLDILSKQGAFGSEFKFSLLF